MTKRILYFFLTMMCCVVSISAERCRCCPPVSLSRNLDEWKQGANKKEVEFLITGCARSGTHYIAKALRLHGVDVSHEGHANFGIVSWTMAVDSNTSPWGPASNNYYFKHIFHQVRHPLKTIASVMMTEPKRSWHFICKEVPEIKLSDPLIIRAAKYWYYWNLRAESKAELTYRVEDAASALPELSRILGYTFDTAYLNQVPKDAGTRRRKPRNLTWLDLRKAVSDGLYDKILCLAERYGYDVREAQRYNYKRKGK